MMAPVKTLTCEGPDLLIVWDKSADGWAPSIHSISGLNFVASEFQRTKTPSVASLSLGGGASNAVDNAVLQVRHMTWIKPLIRPDPLRLF